MEYFRYFVLGSGTDIDRRSVAAIHRREERAFEIRQRNLFSLESGRLLYGTHLGIDICFSAVDTDTPGAVSDMFSCGASVFSSFGSGILRTTFETKGACPAII